MSSGFEQIMDLKTELLLYRDKAASLVRKEGISPDTILVEELSKPGSDKRAGLSFIIRPNEEILLHAISLQKHLKNFEPDQYYYPQTDLHLTLLEIRFDQTLPEIQNLAEKISRLGTDIFSDLKALTLHPSILLTDKKGLALNLLPATNTELQILRKAIIERLNQNSFIVEPRYEAKFGHMTLLRYIQQIEDRDLWLTAIETAPVNTNITWQINDFYLSWGADWYCMLNRNTQFGPYRLSFS